MPWSSAAASFSSDEGKGKLAHGLTSVAVERARPRRGLRVSHGEALYIPAEGEETTTRRRRKRDAILGTGFQKEEQQRPVVPQNGPSCGRVLAPRLLILTYHMFRRCQKMDLDSANHRTARTRTSSPMYTRHRFFILKEATKIMHERASSCRPGDFPFRFND